MLFQWKPAMFYVRFSYYSSEIIIDIYFMNFILFVCVSRFAFIYQI